MGKYPSQETLAKIKNHSNFFIPELTEFLEFIRGQWEFSDMGYFVLTGKKVLRLQLHTGGWSGNESIIDALRQNQMFFPLYWRREDVGGHFYFRIPCYKRKEVKEYNETHQMTICCRVEKDKNAKQ